MVHARAFSFTDESFDVAFPSMTGIGRIPSASGATLGPQSANPSVLLFQLRRCQSSWYQTLFQSDPNDPLLDPAAYVWQMCHEMLEWADSLPETLPPGTRDLFELELKYSYVYCIAPSGRAPETTPHGRALVFEYAIAFVDRVFSLLHAQPTSFVHTYHDTLRMFFMGSQFVSVLRAAPEVLLSGRISAPPPPSRPGVAPPPPMPPRMDSDTNTKRAARCIERVGQTLSRYGDRWADAGSLAQTWEALSADTAAMLQTRLAQEEVQAQATQAQQLQAQRMRFAQSQSPPMMGPPGQTMMGPPPPQMIPTAPGVGVMGMPPPMGGQQGQPGEPQWPPLVDLDIERMMMGQGS
jgi:hypothetical protein